jgi:hypothetical protein
LTHRTLAVAKYILKYVCMLNHDQTPYRWQDYVISPRRGAANLAATALIVLAAAAIGWLGPRRPATTPHVAIASEWTPPLAQIAKRPATHRPAREPLGGG